MTSKLLAQAVASGTLSGNSTDVILSSNGDIELAANNGTDIFIAANNNVGIGNTTPVHKLSINGDAFVNTQLIVGSINGSVSGVLGYSNSNYGVIGYANTGTGTAGWSDASAYGVFGRSNTNFAGYFRSITGPVLYCGNGTNEFARVDNTGRLLVGLTGAYGSSAERLTVNGMVTFVSSANASGNAPLYIYNTDHTASDNQPFLYMHDGSAIRGQIGCNYTDGAMWLNGAFGIYFRNNSGEIARFDSSGKLGIGNTTPTHKLHSYSSDNILCTETSAAGESTMHTYRRSGTTKWQWNLGGSDEIKLYNAMATNFPIVISNTGNLGIGTTAPSQKLEVNGTVKTTGAILRYSPEATQNPMQTRWVQTTSQGANNYTYKLCTISRDPLNWSEYGPIEIIARNTYFQGGSYSRWILTHGYGLSPSLVCVETGGVSGNIPNLYLGAEVTVNSNLKYTPVYCDVPYYRYFNFEINHNYGEVVSITGSTQIKFDNTYTANSSATMYGGNVYLAPAGGAVVVGYNPVLSGLGGTFYVGGGRQVAIDGGSGGAIYIRGDTGGWGMGMYAVGSSGTNRGGFGWLGGADTLSYYWVGQAYNGTGVQLSYGGNSWATLSDARDKNVHGNIQNALDKIEFINSVYYNYKTDEEGTPQRVGFLAQEVQSVYPEAVTELQKEIDNPTEETKRLSLSYTDMVPLLLQGIKELSERVKQLENK